MAGNQVLIVMADTSRFEEYLSGLKDFAARRRAFSRRLILEYIDRYGKAYSAELRSVVDGLSTTYVTSILRELEREGVLESTLESGPFSEERQSGLKRRYYRRISCQSHLR